MDDDSKVSAATSIVLFAAGASAVALGAFLCYIVARVGSAVRKAGGQRERSGAAANRNAKHAVKGQPTDAPAAESAPPSGSKARALNLKELNKLTKEQAKHKGLQKDDPVTHHPLFINTLKGHGDIVGGVSWSADGKALATACEDMTVRVFDVSTISNNNPKFRSISLTQIPVGVGFGASHLQLGVMQKGIAGADRLVYYGSEGQGAKKWEPIWEVADVHNRAEGMILRSIPSGQTKEALPVLVSLSAKKDVRIFGLQGKPMGSAEPNSLANYDLAVSANGRFLSVASFTADVKIWELKYGRDGYRGIEKAMDLKGHSSAVLSVALSADGSRGITVSKDGTLRVWKLDVRYNMNEDPKCLLKVSLPLPPSKCYHRLALWQDHPSTPGVIAAAFEGEIHFLSTETGELITAPIHAHSKRITSLLWSPCEVEGAGGPVLASSGEDYKVRLWKAPVMGA